MYGYIYLIYCDITGRLYIGARRWKDHTTIHKDKYMGSGAALNRDKARFGLAHFHKTILAIAFSLKELNQLEKLYIDKYNAVESPRFYNLKSGGGLA